VAVVSIERGGQCGSNGVGLNVAVAVLTEISVLQVQKQKNKNHAIVTAPQNECRSVTSRHPTTTKPPPFDAPHSSGHSATPQPLPTSMWQWQIAVNPTPTQKKTKNQKIKPPLKKQHGVSPPATQ
jgi:hypothetical protein